MQFSLLCPFEEETGVCYPHYLPSYASPCALSAKGSNCSSDAHFSCPKTLHMQRLAFGRGSRDQGLELACKHPGRTEC
eukprot:85052-Rhodomonas_salina.1